MAAAADALRSDLALANRILFQQCVLDAFGHVSVRDPERGDCFLMSRSKASALVEPDDILRHDLDGQPVEAVDERPYLERFIHAGIYRARSDVNAVVHSHSPAVVPFTVSRRARLRPVCHMSGFLRSVTPLFEIREHAGPGSDLLVRNLELGTALAACLHDAAVVLMRGHGCTVVGSTLMQAVFRAVYTEKNARIQAQAESLGDVEFLTDAEAQRADEANDGQTGRAWELWALQANSSGFHTTPSR
jgi:ribulose-5-phosphate 4-epimerase/fuculose-1-phosphate aldolase